MDGSRPNEPPMPDSLGFFLTWPTYGTWLPGDDRGWLEYQHGWHVGDEARRNWAMAKMREDACLLVPRQRELVEHTVHRHCEIRGWELFVVNCRSNHIHVVVAANKNPKVVIAQLKAWSTRRLKEMQLAEGMALEDLRTQWWVERGSRRYLNDQRSLEAAVQYATEAQDEPKY